VGYQPRLPQRDAPAVAAMYELAAQYPRYGYRRIQVLLARRGHEHGSGPSPLAAAQAASAEKAATPACGGESPAAVAPNGHGPVWAYDSVFDACANGQQLKCLTVVDEFTLECLAIDVAGSIRSGRVIEVLSKLVSVHGSPQYLGCDNDWSLSPERYSAGSCSRISTRHISIRESLGKTDPMSSTASSATSA
jgi:putative transposase